MRSSNLASLSRASDPGIGYQAIESIEERCFGFGRSVEVLKQQRGGFQCRERLAAWLATHSAKTRPVPRVEDEAAEPEEPWVAPPQRLGFAPAAIEQHDAF